MRFERITSWALAVVLTIVSAHLSPAWAGEIFGGRVASEVTLPGECAGNLQPAEGLPLRPALIKFSVSPDGQWLAVSCELQTGAHAVFVGRQGVWRKLDTKEPLFLRAWTTNGRGLWMPFPASLRLTNQALWFANFQVGAFVHPAKIGNGTLYYVPLNGAVVKVFERPTDGQFGTFASDIVPSRDDVVVMQGFAAGQRRIIRLTADGKSEYLPIPSGFSPLYAAPLGPNGAFVSTDGQGKAFIGEKAVVGLPQRESVLFAALGRAFVFPAGDNLEIYEVLPTGSLSSLIFPASAMPVQPGAASSAGLLVEGGGLMLDSREFDTLYLGTSRLVKTGDIVLGVRISSFVRHATAIDDNGAIYFSPSGNVTRVFRLSTPRVSSVAPSTVQQGQDFTITGDSLWFPGGLRTDLVLGAGAPVDACSARSSTELVCSSKNFPLGNLTFVVRVSDGKTSVRSQPAQLTVLPPPAITVTGFTLSRPQIMRGETVDACFATSEAPSDGWFLSFRGKSGASWGIGIGTLGQTNQVLARSASMDDVRVANDHTCVTSRPNEDGEFQLLVGARGNRASAGPLPVTVEVPKPRLTVCEGEPSAVMPMQGTERLVPGGLARFCGENLDGSSVEVLSGFSEAGDAIPEALETLTTTSTEVVAKLPLLAGEIWIRVAREGLVSEWSQIYIAVPPPPEPEPAPEPAPEPGEVP